MLTIKFIRFKLFHWMGKNKDCFLCLFFLSPASGVFSKLINLTKAGYWNTLLREQRFKNPEGLPGVGHGNPGIHKAVLPNLHSVHVRTTWTKSMSYYFKFGSWRWFTYYFISMQVRLILLLSNRCSIYWNLYTIKFPWKFMVYAVNYLLNLHGIQTNVNS